MNGVCRVVVVAVTMAEAIGDESDSCDLDGRIGDGKLFKQFSINLT
jgi:hypothetical protein